MGCGSMFRWGGEDLACCFLLSLMAAKELACIGLGSQCGHPSAFIYTVIWGGACLSKAPPVAANGMSASILWVLEISEIHVRAKMCIFRNCLIFHLVASLPFPQLYLL